MQQTFKEGAQSHSGPSGLGAGFIEEVASELGGRESKGLKFMGFKGMGNLITGGGIYLSSWVVINYGT